MPELDGYEATRQIRAAEDGENMPIIAMTAHSMRGGQRALSGRRHGRLLSKPVQPEQLAAVIRKWIGQPARPRDRPRFIRRGLGT